MQEAVDTFRTPYQLRILFIHLLTNSCVNTPLQLWAEFRHKISEDFILDAMGDVEQGCSKALMQLGTFLQSHGKRLDNYGLLHPIPNSNEVQRELRRWASQAALFQQQVHAGWSTFNPEQRDIFLQVQFAILNNEPLLMFVDGKAGRGKTFLVNVLCAWVRASGRIALPTATSAFAAQLYPGGQTTHLTFGVSLYSFTQVFYLTLTRFLLTNIMNSSNLQLTLGTTNAANYSEDATLLSGTRHLWQTMRFWRV